MGIGEMSLNTLTVPLIASMLLYNTMAMAQRVIRIVVMDAGRSPNGVRRPLRQDKIPEHHA